VLGTCDAYFAFGVVLAGPRGAMFYRSRPIRIVKQISIVASYTQQRTLEMRVVSQQNNSKGENNASRVYTLRQRILSQGCSVTCLFPRYRD